MTLVEPYPANNAVSRSIVVLVIIAFSPPAAPSQCAHGDPHRDGTINVDDLTVLLGCTSGADGAPIPPFCRPNFDTYCNVELQD